jgi:hypothetical protein
MIGQFDMHITGLLFLLFSGTVQNPLSRKFHNGLYSFPPLHTQQKFFTFFIN